MFVTLETPLKELTKIGSAAASRLKTLGLSTVEDLIFYFPLRYEDFSHIVPVGQAKPGMSVTIQGKIANIQTKLTPYKRQNITEALLADDTGEIKLVWFNQPYLSAQLKEGDFFSVSGEIVWGGFDKEMRSPMWEKQGSRVHTGRIVPIYPLTAGLTQKQMRFLMTLALQAVDSIEEWIGEIKNVKCQIMIKKQNKNRVVNVLPLHSSLKNIHFPRDMQILEHARFRLKFDELFFLQIRKALTRYAVKSARATKIEFKEKEIKKFVQSLPFELTGAQRKAAWRILQDMAKTAPMNRLLQGDVGSGKTVVALIAMLNTALDGYQAVIMAPTEILAKQHFETICRLLNGFGINVALVTRSARKMRDQNAKVKVKVQKSKMREIIASGNVGIIIGTHALIQKDVMFKNLALAIIDEQHRFGVEQRKALRRKTPYCGSLDSGEDASRGSAKNSGRVSLGGDKLNKKKSADSNFASPHFLSMTATPIPRSLSLTVYGDLDLSVLNELPKGRKKIITKVVPKQRRNDAYDFIANQIQHGRQVFVICPLIDESDKLGVKSVTQEHERLDKEVFPHLSIGLLHGKLNDKEKDQVQQDFIDRKYDILVATSVVEVGVDVPNASVMMIEGAERFGLSQLHQFRGRVGRTEHQSYCFLFMESAGQNVFERIDFFAQNVDGFKIAEFDLKHRGAGNVYGTQQHGFPEFRIATFDDYDLIEQTQQLARDVVEQDPELKNAVIVKKKVERSGGLVHLE